jgi:hypothetical protein
MQIKKKFHGTAGPQADAATLIVINVSLSLIAGGLYW